MLRVPSTFRFTLARAITMTCAQAAARLLAGSRRWEVRSAGAGSKGQRWYAWALLATASPRHHLLIRRHLGSGELAFCSCFVPDGQRVSLARLIRAAGLRWAVEVGHPWHRSSRAGFSWLRSLLAVGFLFGRCPAGAGVEAGGAGSALA